MGITTNRNWKLIVGLPLLLATLVLGQQSCVIDSAIGSFVSKEHVEPPPAPPTYLNGQVETADPFGLPGEAVTAYVGNGQTTSLRATAGDDGTFQMEIPGTQGYQNLLLYTSDGSVVLMGIVPDVPRAQAVWDEPQYLNLGDQAPQMQPIDDVSTTLVLLMEGDLRADGLTFLDVSPSSVVSAMDELEGRLDEPAFATFADMVVRVLTVAASSTANVAALTPPDQILDVGSSLNPEFLTANAVDYDGDGTDDTTTEAWEAAIAAATEAFFWDVCFDPDTIRVVFQVRWEPPLIDGNCEERSRTIWLDGIDPGDTMMIVGGVHESQVRCEDDPDYEYCATQRDVNQTNRALGDWEPNNIVMYDDGTNGDAAASDGVYTLVVDLPRGIRIGYKYTFGPPGQPFWTGTEEWPGNQRLLEMIDINGDGMVVRRDNFGDEASNKDRANLSTWPPLEYRGNVVWSCGDTGENCCGADVSESGVAGCMDINGDGYVEFHETAYDFDGDCVPDRFPSGSPNSPITIPCEQL